MVIDAIADLARQARKNGLIGLDGADKLAAKVQVEHLIRTLVIEGTLHIQSKTNPGRHGRVPERVPAGEPARRGAGRGRLRPVAKKGKGKSVGAPGWLVTFADLMSLLVAS